MFSKKLIPVLLIVFCFANSLKAQYLKDGEPGKTYYDSSYLQVCEIFHHDLRYVFITDTVKHEKVFKEVLVIKHGPYNRYYPDGKLERSGYYFENEMDSIWQYYGPKGEIIKTEKYRNNIQIE